MQDDDLPPNIEWNPDEDSDDEEKKIEELRKQRQQRLEKIGVQKVGRSLNIQRKGWYFQEEDKKKNKPIYSDESDTESALIHEAQKLVNEVRLL